MTQLYYKPSGQVPLIAIPLACLYGILTLPTAWIYAWLIIRVPAIFTVILTLFFSLWIGFLVKGVATRAKVRNPSWMANCGIGIALTGWYFHWAAWIALTTSGSQNTERHPYRIFIYLATNPFAMFEDALSLMKLGTWSLGGERITGATLAIFWIIELLILASLPKMLGRMRAEEPFCEASLAWAEEIEVPRKFAYIEEPHAVSPLLEQHPDQLLEILTPWSESVSRSHSKVIIYRCRGTDSYLSIRNIVAALVKGKVEESAKFVLEYMRLPGIDPDELIRKITEILPQHPDESRDRPVPTELEFAVGRLNDAQYEEAFAAAVPFVNSNEFHIRTDAMRLCGITSSRLGRWADAFHYWEVLFNDEPTALNALQAASSSVMAGNLDCGTLWLDRAKTLNVASRDLPGLTIQTNFITALSESGQMLSAIPYLEEIKLFYTSFGVTDPTVLFANQYPLFETFLNNSIPIIRAAFDIKQGRSWYTSMLPHLDDRGKLELSKWVNENFTVA